MVYPSFDGVRRDWIAKRDCQALQKSGVKNTAKTGVSAVGIWKNAQPMAAPPEGKPFMITARGLLAYDRQVFSSGARSGYSDRAEWPLYGDLVDNGVAEISYPRGKGFNGWYPRGRMISGKKQAEAV